MVNDNSLLLIILIGITLFWIFNMNSTTKEIKQNKTKSKSKSKSKEKDYKLEKFTTTGIPLLKQNNVPDKDLIDKLYAEHTSESMPITSVPRNSYTNGVSPNNKQTLIDPPPSLTQDNESNRKSRYQNMAKQFISDDKQPMYPKDNQQVGKSYQAFDDTADYMLLPKDNLPDPKFQKVMPTETRRALQSSDLLPIDENKDWFQVPNKDFNLMQAVDLEVPEIKIGIDTVGQSRKNATYDIRAAPPCPKFVVSPWGNSTIDPDYNTKPLC